MIAIIVGYFAADLMAGFWHFLEDRYFDPKWPVIGKWIAAPNELHHVSPMAFLKGGYLHRNSTTIIPAAIAMGVAVACRCPSWVLWMFAFVSQANEIHAMAHRRPRLWVLRLFQNIGIIQSPQHHAKHHRRPFDARYCVMTNWLNPALDFARIWHCIEIVFRSVGIKPK